MLYYHRTDLNESTDALKVIRQSQVNFLVYEQDSRKKWVGWWSK